MPYCWIRCACYNPMALKSSRGAAGFVMLWTYYSITHPLPKGEERLPGAGWQGKTRMRRSALLLLGALAACKGEAAHTVDSFGREAGVADSTVMCDGDGAQVIKKLSVPTLILQRMSVESVVSGACLSSHV
jgi:hypothetical protein